MTSLVFVAPYGLAGTMKFVDAAATLDGVTLGLVSQEPASDLVARMSSDTRDRIRGFVQVDNAFDPDRLEAAVRRLAAEMGTGQVDALAAILEPLQVPLAAVRERLGIRGMDAAEADRFRNKSHMKDTLRSAGLPCARHLLATSATEAMAFAAEVMPLVAKPPAGAGAVDTFRIDEPSQLETWLAHTTPSPERPLLLEEFIQGEEFSFDSVTIDGRHVFHSISSYSPTPLEVMSTPWIQWTVLFPRHIDRPEFAPITEAGPAALAALGMVTGMSHMEWFRRSDGSIAISEVGARPPGAQMTSLLSYTHGHDFYRAWAELNAFGTFQPPPRSYAAGAAYLRGMGSGRVSHIEGIEAVHREVGDLVVEARLPGTGQAKSSSYEGEGYVILRHPDTEVVADGLRKIVSGIRVHLAEQ